MCITATCLINGESYDRFYNDTGDLPTTPLLAEAERAFRDAFLVGAREASEWDFPNVDAVEAAREAREEARCQAEVLVTSGEAFQRPFLRQVRPAGYAFRLPPRPRC